MEKKIKDILPTEILRLIRLIGAASRENGCDAFLVGGFVRDVLLGVRNFDLDIVVEGDAMRLAKDLVKKAGGSYVLHERFGTATAVLPWPVRSKKIRLDEVKIDFATARKERYKNPAALPTVEFSTVREDLYRRDFTINAMAVAVADKTFGHLIDFFGGRNDLLDKKIRVLHDASFLDDPTRILRAVRFEQRFDFKIEPRTEGLIKEALNKKMLDKTQKQRLRDELILILNEDRPGKALKRMDALGGLGFIYPKLRFKKTTEKFFNSIKETILWAKSARLKKGMPDAWLIYLMALLDALTMESLKNVCAEFVFKKNEQLWLYSYKKNSPGILRFLEGPRRVPASELFKRLEPLSYEAMVAIMSKSRSGIARKRISDFLTKYDGVTLKIKGGDLEALGLKAGPDFKKILTLALYAKLDKGFKNKNQELYFVKSMKGKFVK